MAEPTLEWWALLRSVFVLNLIAWAAAAVWLLRQHPAGDAAAASRRWQLWLSFGYVLGCGWRCLLPVYDVPRLVLVDSWFSSVLIGRSVASVAELCFAAQWALLLREMSRHAGSGFGAAVSRAVLPLIVVAECCSWTAVLTTSNLGHVIEESLWGLCAALLVASLVHVGPRVSAAQRRMLWLFGTAGTLYVIYMFGVDVPMYWQRWLADEALGREYLSLLQGAIDVSSRWVVSHRWDDWKSEVVWMSLYFSVAVWLSISLVRITPAAAPARWSSATRRPDRAGAPSSRPIAGRRRW
jgi:hypothetical protein